MLDHRFKDNFVASAVWVLLLTSVAGSQSVTGNTIVGKVRTQSGHPVANVLVELQTGTGALVTQTFSTNEGDYAFSGLEGASFVLAVDDPNHQPFAERVELTRSAATRPGEMVRIDIVLTPKSQASTHASATVFRQNIPPAALEAYKRGVKLLAEHKSNEGIAALNEALRLMPNYFDAHFALGLELFHLARLNDAIASLEKARAINPNDGRLYYTFGLVLGEQKKYALASRVLAEAWKLNPSDFSILLSRGTFLIEDALSINQASPAAQAERDTLLGMARTDLLKALELSGGKLAAAHYQLARVYERTGDRSRAADELEQYLRLSPDDKKAEAIRAAIKTLRARAKQ
jgi:tetratricopeptide (TPR) repeat protein